MVYWMLGKGCAFSRSVIQMSGSCAASLGLVRGGGGEEITERCHCSLHLGCASGFSDNLRLLIFSNVLLWSLHVVDKGSKRLQV